MSERYARQMDPLRRPDQWAITADGLAAKKNAWRGWRVPRIGSIVPRSNVG